MQPGCRALVWILILSLFQSVGALASPPDTVHGVIDGANLGLDVTLTLTTDRPHQSRMLVEGPVVLDGLKVAGAPATLSYDKQHGRYALAFARAGTHTVSFTLAVRSELRGAGAGLEASFALPRSSARQLVVTADRADVEVDLPGALRTTRQLVDGRMRVTGVQGARSRVVVRWVQKVQDLDAALVFTSRADTVVNLSPDTLRVDSVLSYTIAQGSLEVLELRVPRGLSVTQVRGEHVRDWRRDARPEQDTDLLVVTLSRPQRGAYALQVIAQAGVPPLPTPLEVPMIEPQGGLRAEGYLTVGTDSAIQLVVDQAQGLAQVDAADVPRVELHGGETRAAPTGKAFSYRYAALPARMTLALARVKPGYDAVHRVVVRVGADDLTVEDQVELDVRDAPLRQVTLGVPAGLTVVDVLGPAVDDYRAQPAGPGGRGATVTVWFAQPVRGRTALGVRMERGGSALSQAAVLEGLSVQGARTQRGFVTLAAEAGIDLTEVAPQSLREVGVAAAPMRVDDARRAWRLDAGDWSLSFTPQPRSPQVRSEALHLLTLGEGIAYGNVVVSYSITEAPTDVLKFKVDPRLSNVSFVGRDVRRAAQDPADPTRWTVTLHRRVIGDYNLGVSYTQPYEDGGALIAAGVRCAQTTAQSGVLAITSRLNLRLAPEAEAGSGLLPIERATPSRWMRSGWGWRGMTADRSCRR